MRLSDWPRLQKPKRMNATGRSVVLLLAVAVPLLLW